MVGFNFLTFIQAVAIATVITLLLVYDNGPKNLFVIIRFYAGINVLPMSIYHEGQPIDNKKALKLGYIDFESNGSMTAKLLSCHRCTGFWIGVIVGLVVFGINIMHIMSISALAILINEYISAIRDTSESVYNISNGINNDHTLIIEDDE